MYPRNDPFYVLTESAPDAIFFGANGYFRYLNPAALRLFGATSTEELLGLSVVERIHPKDRALVAERIKRLQAQGETAQPMEQTYLRLDGTPVEVEVNAVPFRFNGESGGLVFVRDISERKAAERITDQYRSVIQASIDGFWVTDTSGHILDVNDAICRISGYPREELLRLSIPDIEADETPADTAAHIRQMVETGHVQFEARHRRKDGTIINVEVSILHIPKLADRLFCFIRDITERKQAEAELIATKEEAERSSKAKSEFIQAMHHELRTPLAVVLGQAESLEAELVDESQKQQLAIIQRAGWDLLTLINQVLDLGAIEIGNLHMQIRPVDADALLRGCMETIAPLAAEHDMEMCCVADADVAVLADHEWLKQAVLNYLSNAVKYGRLHGIIRLTATQQQGWVRIAVADEGDGIALERQPGLFKSFDRLGREGSCIRGVGLGLSLTKGLIEQMGGRVGVDSQPGQGSSFWIDLPAATARPELGEG